MKNKKEKKNDVLIEISAAFPTADLPETAIEMVNTYGTYEIQNTSDTINQYPAIAQGYNSKIKIKDCENKGSTGNSQSDR